MDPWTSTQRNAFIERAVNSESSRGYSGPYHFCVFPRNPADMSSSEESKKTSVTNALAKVIFNNPKYRIISLQFYDQLTQKIETHPFLEFYIKEIAVVMKGSNAYAFMLGEEFPQDFPFSDMDICIFINPNLPEDLFNSIQDAMSTLVLQVISQYKRTLDHMFFLNRSFNDCFMDPETIESFKKDLNKALEEITFEEGVFMSPFENDDVRNHCSRNSFMIIESEQRENSVVRVEVPHYERCERIPLRKSPIFASYNSTIQFKRVEEDVIEEHDGDFDLFRLRWNCLFVGETENDDIHEERVSADFIDVTISSQYDSELVDFWESGRYMRILEETTNIWINVPDSDTCLNDLYKMLYVYDCPEHKRSKRLEKYEKMMMITGAAEIAETPETPETF